MDVQLSPGAWLEFLEPRLDEQIKIVTPYQEYFDGEHRLQMATAKFREAFSRFFPPIADNWMKVVVETPVSRLEVQGFRFEGIEPGQTLTTDDGKPKPPWELDADEEAWKMWQANNLDSASRMLFTDAGKLGVSYVLVAPPRVEGGQPRITAEKATQCYVYTDPEDTTHRLAGLKRWVNDFDGRWYCNVYLPDAIYKFIGTEARKAGKIQWTGLEKVSNPAGVVPLVPIENRTDLEYGGRSDLEDAIPIQDAVNKYCLDMIVSSEFHAFPQRWGAGWERATDSKGRELSNREVELYLSASRFVRAESADAKFGTFEQGNVENYLKPIEMYIDHLAAQTQTPLYYLKGKMTTMSADSMHAQDQGLVDRCKSKHLSFSDGLEEMMRVGFLMKGDRDRGEAESAETIWAGVESKSLAVVAQAAMIWRTQLQVPLEMCWQLLGWTPMQIRMALDLMGLPPGGGPPPPPSPAALSGGFSLGPNGENDPSSHPGNQKGQPSGQASQAAAS